MRRVIGPHGTRSSNASFVSSPTVPVGDSCRANMLGRPPAVTTSTLAKAGDALPGPVVRIEWVQVREAVQSWAGTPGKEK